MATPAEIPFQELLDALLDESTPFHPRYLYRLSDLSHDDFDRFQETWPRVPLWRRQALMEDVEELGENNYLLSFDALARLALLDENAKVRAHAVRTLWEYEDDELIPVFLDLLERDADAEVRSAAATGLGKYIFLREIEEIDQDTFRRIEDILLRVVAGSDEIEVRRHALESLGYSSREEVPVLILAAYETENKDWLASALFAMGRSANEAWETHVIDMFDHTIPDIRMEAARAAGELELEEAVDPLIELLDDADQDVRFAAAWSLSRIGGEGVREILEEMQESAEDEEEVDFLEDALENLTFTEDMALFGLLDIPEETTDKVVKPKQNRGDHSERKGRSQTSSDEEDALPDLDDDLEYDLDELEILGEIEDLDDDDELTNLDIEDLYLENEEDDESATIDIDEDDEDA